MDGITVVPRRSVAQRSGRARASRFLLRWLAMNETEMQGGASPGVPDPTAIIEREEGLRQELSPWQVAMIGLGSSMGTGLFLGSAISVKLAGPAGILGVFCSRGVGYTGVWGAWGLGAGHPPGVCGARHPRAGLMLAY